MPNGVIWGGAVDGSNQLGAIVTCQAMVTWPAGVCPAAGGAAPRSAPAASAARARRGRVRGNRVGAPMVVTSVGAARCGIGRSGNGFAASYQTLGAGPRVRGEAHPRPRAGRERYGRGRSS